MVTGHAQLQKGSSSEAIIGLLHQAEAFMINYAIDPFAGQNGSRHWQVVRRERERERERELRKEGREVPSRVRLREGPIGVRITLGQPTIG